MSKKLTQPESGGPTRSISKEVYKDTQHKLQVKLQRHFIECDEKFLIILEGRDASYLQRYVPYLPVPLSDFRLVFGADGK